MKIQALAFAVCSALLLVSAAEPVQAQALSPVFTYQGELRLASGPASASYDMQFRLYSAQAGGSQIGITITESNITVTAGLFSVPLDFGAAQFAGDRQWLEIAIRPAGAGTYETLSPRSEVTATPYAWSASVALVDSVTGSSVVDASIGSADINSTQIQRRVTGTCAVGNYVRQVNQDGTVVCSADGGGTGTVTSIATGTGLTGGPITASGTVAVAAGGIGSAEINANQVQRRVSGSCSIGNFVREINQDGTVVCSPDAAGAPGWSLDGNAGTTPQNFLGTTDDQPLVFRTRNAQSLRIEPSAALFNGTPITSNMIAGSSANSVSPAVLGATIAGGGVPEGDTDPNFGTEGPNRVSDSYGVVGGGYNNRAGNDNGSAIDVPFASVGGGLGNNASGIYSTVSGGSNNRAGTQQSTVSGGRNNAADGANSTVSGGTSNVASGAQSTASGGSGNTASGANSTVSGGIFNTAAGAVSTVSGGTTNCAGGDRSWAGGLGALIRPGNEAGDGTCVAGSGDANGDELTFLWAGGGTTTLVSTGPSQFGVAAAGIFFGNISSSSVSIPAGRFINTASGAHLTTGGAWTNASSRRLKTAFEVIDPLAVLSRVASLPLSTWIYKESVEGRHLGPMAEDFKNAFGLGGDGESIATVDADGVALAAIQGLNLKLEAQNAALRAELAELRAMLLSDRAAR